MIRLLSTTALALVMAGGVSMAQTDDPATPMPTQPAETVWTKAAGQWMSDQLIGADVFDKDGEAIGEISELVLDFRAAPDATAPAGGAGLAITDVVVGVGGFLGIGTKRVAIPVDRLEFFTGDRGQQKIVANITEEELEAMPAFAPAQADSGPAPAPEQ